MTNNRNDSGALSGAVYIHISSRGSTAGIYTYIIIVGAAAAVYSQLCGRRTFSAGWPPRHYNIMWRVRCGVDEACYGRVLTVSSPSLTHPLNVDIWLFFNF